MVGLTRYSCAVSDSVLFETRWRFYQRLRTGTGSDIESTRSLCQILAAWTSQTRLSKSIGTEPACELYRAFVREVVSRFGETVDERVIVFSPDNRRAEFSALAGKNWKVVPQGDGDLGQRMRQFIADSLAGGAEKVVIIGTDSPTLPRGFVDEAFQQLSEADVVFGPTKDGGYYLIGAARRVPPVFDDIQWSSEHVLAQTAERLEENKYTWCKLPQWYDVDELNDLICLRDELDEQCLEVFEDIRRAVNVALNDVQKTDGQFGNEKN